MLMRTFTLLVLLLAFAGCDETGQMINPVLLSEITEPTQNFVVVDGKELPVFDTFEQALIQDVTPFISETIPPFYEHYCRFETWSPRGLSAKRFNPLNRDGNPFTYLEHVILFSDKNERYKMIEHFKGMEGGKFVSSFKQATKAKIIGESRSGSETTFHWMRWGVVERNFDTDVVPTDYRDDERYPSSTYEPFTDHITGKTFIPIPDANIMMLILVYHPIADKHLEQCGNLKDEQRRKDSETALIEYNKEAIKPTPIMHDPESRWQTFLDETGGEVEDSKLWRFLKTSFGGSDDFRISHIETGIDAWNHEVTQLWLNEYFMYFCKSGYASWGKQFYAHFTNQQARDDFLQILIDADLQGGLSQMGVGVANQTAFRYSIVNDSKRLMMQIDNVYLANHGCKKATVDPEWNVIVVGQE